MPGKSVLGFLPLYPLVIRAVAEVSSFSLLGAALITSFAGGLISAVLVQRLATLWWGEAAGRQATLVFCVFPGPVVFSMAYSECLTLPWCSAACSRWRPAGGWALACWPGWPARPSRPG